MSRYPFVILDSNDKVKSDLTNKDFIVYKATNQRVYKRGPYHHIKVEEPGKYFVVVKKEFPTGISIVHI